VKGPSGNGQVALATERDVLKIYLAAKGGLEETPIKLVDEMFTFCHMESHNPPHSEMCLHIALSQNDPARILKVFTDKGIPTLESLKFADADESNSDDDAKCTQKTKDAEGKSSSSDGPKKMFGRAFATAVKDQEGKDSSSGGPKNMFARVLPVAGAIIGFPVVIAVALGGLATGKKHSDGSNTGDHTFHVTRVKTTANGSTAKSPKVPTSNNQRRSGPNGFDKFQKSMSKGLLHLQQIACSSEDVAFKGEFAVSGHQPSHFASRPNTTQTD